MFHLNKQVLNGYYSFRNQLNTAGKKTNLFCIFTFYPKNNFLNKLEKKKEICGGPFYRDVFGIAN